MEIHIGWPEGIALFCMITALGHSMARHGESKFTYYDFWEDLLIGAINLALLFWGGFFS